MLAARGCTPAVGWLPWMLRPAGMQVGSRLGTLAAQATRLATHPVQLVGVDA